MYSVKSQNIHLEAQKDYEEYGSTMQMNAMKSINFTATATIDISAPMIRES